MNDEQWISIKDRLPTEQGKYRVKVRTGNSRSLTFEIETSGEAKGEGFKFHVGHFQTVIAWLPIEE